VDEIRGVKVRYRSSVNGRVAIAYIKAPYGALYDLNEKLTRMLATRQIRWFRVDAMTPQEWSEHRIELARWPIALRATSQVTRVNWEEV
jgi:hypothetical protein